MNSYYNPEDRAKEKQISREKDKKDLKSGKKTKEQLHRENTFLNPKGGKINFSAAKPGSFW